MLLIFFYFTREVLPHRGTPHNLLVYIFENLLWGFVARICRRNLLWLFAVCIFKQILFCEQILFIWKQTFFICEQNFFSCEIFFINSVSFCYCRRQLWTTVMLRQKLTFCLKNCPKKQPFILCQFVVSSCLNGLFKCLYSLLNYKTL